MGGKGSGGARKKVRPDDKRRQNAGPPATTIEDQRLSPLARLAIDLGYTSRASFLKALGERYEEEPGLVRTALHVLWTADERRVYAACVDEMLAEKNAPPPGDFIL